MTQTEETHPAIDPASNRFEDEQGYTFDANGNIVVDAEGREFTFNGDNKQTEVKDDQNRLLGKYFYDGEGRRVKKQTYDEEGDPKDVTVFVYSAGRLIAEYTTEAPPEDPTTRFTVTDQLGSPRVILDSAGDVVSRRDFLPFGEEIAPDETYRKTDHKYGEADQVRQKFTGYQHDGETGLDFDEARMYENRHGRFTAVDPLLASGRSADPQTFNRYVYVANSPLVMIDPTGMVMDDWYIKNDGDISVRRTNDKSDNFFVFDENKTNYTLVATLEKNGFGLVEFPDSGHGFTRYGRNDEGGNDPIIGEDVGSGDRFLKPEVAASLFGLTNQLRNQFGITMALGDMSSSNGSDPWSPDYAGQKDRGHHVGHGHLGNRSGLDIDFRYIGNDGNSRQGDFEISLLGGRQTGSPTSKYTNGFSIEKNQAVFDTAVKFGFRMNYHDIVQTSRVNGTSDSLGLRGATPKDGHRNHGHLGYVPGQIQIKKLR